MKKLIILSLVIAFASGISAFSHKSSAATATSDVYYKDINGHWQLYLEGDECPVGSNLICERPDPNMPSRIVPLYKSQTENDFLRYDP